VSTGSGQGLTFQESVEAASLAMPTNAEKSLRTVSTEDPRAVGRHFIKCIIFISMYDRGQLIARPFVAVAERSPDGAAVAGGDENCHGKSPKLT
jgi:hypothetical protein